MRHPDYVRTNGNGEFLIGNMHAAVICSMLPSNTMAKIRRRPPITGMTIRISSIQEFGM